MPTQLERFTASLARLTRFEAASLLSRNRRSHPKLLYKFAAADSKSLKGTIVISEVWLSSRQDFNDPFDLHVTISFEGTSAEKMDFLRGAATRMGVPFKLRQKAAERAYQAGAFASRAAESFAQRVDNYGVCCFAKRAARNVQMWAYYGNQRGVCQFHVARSPDPFALALPVTYSDEAVTINWLKQREQSRIGEAFFTKALRWEHEAEHRIINSDGARIPLAFRPEALAGVILGAMSTRRTQLRIVAMCRRRRALGMPAVKLYRAMPGRGYRLEIRRAVDLEALVSTSR